MAKRESKESEYDLIDAILTAYEYDTFDPHAFRQSLKDNGWTTDDLKVALALYCQIGNNVKKASVKRKGKDQRASSVMGKLSEKVTLARIALSYPADVLAIRKRGLTQKKISKRFDLPGVPEELQDPALYCYMNRIQYDQFSRAFSEAVKSKPSTTDFWALAQKCQMHKEPGLLGTHLAAQSGM